MLANSSWCVWTAQKQLANMLANCWRLFLCCSHTPTWVCQHKFANFSLLCEGRFRVHVFSLKRSTVGALTEPFRVLSQKNMGDDALFKNWYPLGRKTISSHAHKAGSWYFLGVLFKISDGHPCPFYLEVPPWVIMAICRATRKICFLNKTP